MITSESQDVQNNKKNKFKIIQCIYANVLCSKYIEVYIVGGGGQVQVMFVFIRGVGGV